MFDHYYKESFIWLASKKVVHELRVIIINYIVNPKIIFGKYNYFLNIPVLCKLVFLFDLVKREDYMDIMHTSISYRNLSNSSSKVN